LVAHLGTKATTNIFHCPRDIDNTQRTIRENSGRDAYYYSYSFNSSDVSRSGVNPGMTTVVNHARTVFPFKLDQVVAPARKIMTAEGISSLLPTEAPPPAVSNLSAGCVTSGGWVPFNVSTPTKINNYLTIRHDGNANVAFAHGHVQAVPWRFGTLSNNAAPTFNRKSMHRSQLQKTSRTGPGCNNKSRRGRRGKGSRITACYPSLPFLEKN
jgi:hypothetical protein